MMKRELYMIEIIKKDPFRLLFPTGILMLLMGVLVWLIPIAIDEDVYPIIIHRYLMVNGFLFCFVAGFLMTAVPQFSGAPYVSMEEVLLYLLITILGFFLVLLEIENIYSWITIGQSLILLCFLAIRIKKRTQNPPYVFIFLILGLLLNLFYGLIDAFSLNLSTNFYLPLTLIILGVGGRLIPGILGHSQIVTFQRDKYENKNYLYQTIPFSVYLMILAIFISLIVPESRQDKIMLFVVLYWGFKFCCLHKTPQKKSVLTWGIWLSSWILVLSFLLGALASDIGIHVTHSLFIGTFLIMTILVASRVLRAHGSGNVDLENSPSLLIFIVSTILGLVGRVSVIFMEEGDLNHYAYASVLIVFGVIVWSLKFLPEIFIIPKNLSRD